MLRFQDLDDLSEPNAWIDTARDRLRELDEHLFAAGWQREPGTGRHWWSLTYTDAARTVGQSDGSRSNSATY